MCVCVCVRVSFSLLLRAAVAVAGCGGGGREGRKQTETVTTDSLRSVPQVAEIEQPCLAQRMFGEIGNVLLSTCSQTENGEDPLVSLVNL